MSLVGGGTGNAVSGSGNTVYSAGSERFSVAGNSNTVELANTGNTLSLNGGVNNAVDGSDAQIDVSGSTSNTISGNSDTVDASSNTGGLVTGTNNSLNEDGSSESFNVQNAGAGTDTVNIGGSGDYAGLLGGSGYSVNTDGASGNSIATSSNTTFAVSGGNTAIGAGTGSVISLTSGTGYGISVSGGAVAAASGVTATVSGNYNQIVQATQGSVGVAGGSVGDAVGSSSGSGSSVGGGSGGTLGNGSGSGDGVSGGSSGSEGGLGAGSGAGSGTQSDNIEAVYDSSGNFIGGADPGYESTLASGETAGPPGSFDSAVAAGEATAAAAEAAGATPAEAAAAADAASAAPGSPAADGASSYGFASGYGAETTATLNSFQNAAGTGTTVLNGLAAGLQSALGSRAGTTTQPEQFEGAQWSGRVITWSLATAGGPFSGAVTGQAVTVVQQAMAAWSAASGLTLRQVSNPSAADIQIGYGDLNTSSTGVLGLTTYQSNAGQFDPGVAIQLEDPNQTPLAEAADGQLAYSGANATLYQLALHEIGHALGLADSADPNSIMYYKLGSGNQGLDDTDLTNIASLYGSASQTEASAAPSSVSPADNASVAADDKSITVGGSHNSITLGQDDFVSDTAGSADNTFSLTAGHVNLMIAGSGDQIFLSGGSALVNEQASQLTVRVSSAQSILEIANFQTGAGAEINLMGGVGGYANAAQVLSALHENRSGDVVLALGGTGYIQFDHTIVADFTTHNFLVS